MNKENEFYTYIFVRTDLSSREQVLVQAAHVTCLLGQFLLANEIYDYPRSDLNFVVCGANSKEELTQVEIRLNKKDIKFVTWTEDDLNGELTALATYPISYTDKMHMIHYKLLKFE